MPDTPATEPVPDAHAESPETPVPPAEPVAAAEPAATRPAGDDPAWCSAELKRRFPALFTGGPKPIKLRIQQDIQERAPGVFSKQMLSAYFRRLTGSTSYLIALTRAKERYDLDGQSAGELSDEHRQAAVQELERRRAVRHEREEREFQEQRARATLLRDFERTTLTPANFCALKGIDPAALEPLLARARAEAAAWAEQRPRPDRDRPPPHGRPPGPRPDGRPQNARPGERGPAPPQPPRRNEAGMRPERPQRPDRPPRPPRSSGNPDKGASQ